MKLYCETCQKPFPVTAEAGAAAVKCPHCGKDIPVPEKNVAPGVVIGDFLIEKPLSHGGMGEVYIARQLSLDRPVALKVLQDRFNKDREYVDGLFREARAAAKITHPNIVQAYAVGEEDGVYYFAMELIRGETFKKILQREKVLSFTQAAKVIREVAGALDVAWREQKLVHQDIKPDNIMLDSNGFAKLADLGLARKASANDKADDSDEVMGTPQYISPEQLTGVPTDVRSDIYSLGATFFQFVTGRFPYVADTAEEISRMHVDGNLVPPKNFNPELPDALNDIIVKMMARDISKRYQLPSELIKDLDNFLSAAGRKPGKLTLKPLLQRTGAKGGAGTGPQQGGQASPAEPTSAAPAEKPVAPPVARPVAKPVAKPAAKPARPLPVGKKPAAVPAVPAKPQPPDAGGSGGSDEEDQEPAQEEGGTGGFWRKLLKRKSGEEGSEPQFERKPVLKWVLLSVTILIVVAAGLAAAFYFAAKADKLPEKLKPWGEKLLTKLGQTPAAQPKPAPDAPEAPGSQGPPPPPPPKGGPHGPGPGGRPLPPPPPPPPPKPKTRPDYVNTLEALRSEFRNTPASRRGKLLDKADETFARLGHPQTPEEHAVLCGAWEMYSTVDEMLRFRPGRENARKQYEAAAEARRAAKEEEARQQRQRQEAEEQRKREQEEQSAKLARDQEQRQRETAARTEKLKKELDAICVSLVKAMILSAESGDGQQLADALASADNYIISSECDTPAERQLIAQFQALKRGVKGAGDAYGKFIASCAQFQSRGLFMVGRNTLAKLTGIRTNGDVTYVTTRNVQGVFRPETEKQRAQLLKHLMKNTSLPPVTAFYYGLMTRHVTPDVEKQAPSPFWKNALRFYREAFLK